MSIFTRFVLLAGLVTLLTHGVANAQQRTELGGELAASENKYRIGLACDEVSAVLRLHLRLPDDSGLLVNAVLDDSPAGRAGIQRFDVIVEANGKPVASVFDLVTVVNDVQENAMDLAIIRRGEHQVIRVTPEERPADIVPRLRRGLPGIGRQNLADLPPELWRHLEEFERLQIPGQPGFNLRRFLPGIIMDDPDWTKRTLPKNFSLQIEKKDDGPAKINVKRSDQAWSVTEDNLDELPEDLRLIVQNMLNGSRSQLFGTMIPGIQPPRRDLRGRRTDPSGQFDKRFDGLELQLKELQDAIRAMQEDRNR